MNQPKFTSRLVELERRLFEDIIFDARNAKLTRDEFEAALSWFYGGERWLYAHYLDDWDRIMLAQLG